MFHICCKFHTHVLLYVSLMFELYSIYVSFAFHICFVLCLTYVPCMFHICFVYVSHMFLLTPRHSLCLRHARPPSIETILGAPLDQANI